MAYASSARLTVLLKEYSYASDSDLLTEGSTQGDNRVDRYITRNIKNYTAPATTPQEFIDAGTLYTASAILDILLSNQDKRSPSAIRWEEEANEIMSGYVDTYLSENEDSGSIGSPVRFMAVYNADQMEEDQEEEE